jgi:5-methylcytosine-specific restriction endonuclease McrA
MSPRDQFYNSRAWLELRYQVLKRSRGRCECCGARPSDVNPLNVDHIQPRSTHRHLELVSGNLQVLCSKCNFGKSNTDDTDWRYVVSVDEPGLEKIITLSASEKTARKEMLDRAINGSTEAEREAAKAIFVSIERYERGIFQERSSQ